MRTLRTKRPSPALVISLVALMVALGGTAYAGLSIPKNSVGTKQLKNSAVTTKKIKNGAVTTKQIENGTVTASKINTSGLTVPNALHANSATTANSATSAGTATTAESAANATNAANATSPSTLGSGQTETGAFALGGSGTGVTRSVSAIWFPFPLAVAPASNVIATGGPSTAACPGTAAAPAAAAGQLCIYQGAVNNAGTMGVCPTTGSLLCNGPGKHGAELQVSSSAAGDFTDAGTWAVTG